MPGPYLWGSIGRALNLQQGDILPNGGTLTYEGNKNYIGNASFENQLTTGWSLFNTTMSGTTPTGTVSAGATGLTLGVTTSSPLAGTASLQVTANLSSIGIWPVGTGVISDAFTIDNESQSQPLNFSFHYQAATNGSFFNWSGTSANTLSVYIYDVVVGAWSQPVGVYNLKTGIGVGTASGFFQPASPSSTQFRIAILAINSSLTAAGASNIIFDDFFLGPAVAGSTAGPVDWMGNAAAQAVTASITNIAFTTVKDSSGAWNGTQYIVQTAGDYIVTGQFITGNATGQQCQVFLNGVNQANFSYVANSGSPSSGGTMLPNLKIGDAISMRAIVTQTIGAASMQISMIQSSGVGPAGQVVTSQMFSASSIAVTANQPIPYTTIVYDTTGALTTGAASKFTAQVSGYYDVFINGAARTASAGQSLLLYKNSSAADSFVTFPAAGFSISGATQINCNAGDTLDIRCDGSITLTPGVVTFSLRQGPSALTSNPTVSMKYANTAGTSIPNTGDNNVPFATKVFDSTNSYNTSTGIYTVPVSGKYNVRGTVNYSSQTYGVNNQLVASVYKNGAIESYGEISPIMAIVTLAFGSVVDTSVQCNAGDTLEIRAQNTRSAGATILNTGAGFNHIEISRAGN